MPNNDKQINKLLNFADDPGLAIFDELQAINDNLDEVKNLDLSGLEILQGEKGEQGDKGDVGEQGIQGKQGIKGDKGDPGKNGIDGIDGLDGIDGKNGLKGKDGSPDTADEIKNKLESLIGENRLDSSAIKNLPKLAERLARDGYPYGLPQPAASLTYFLNGAQVGRGNILNLVPGPGVTITQGPNNGDEFTYIISSTGGGGGIDTLGPIGTNPNANAATITGTTLNLEPASSSFGGVVTTGGQHFAGIKRFDNIISASQGIEMGISQPVLFAAHLSLTSGFVGPADIPGGVDLLWTLPDHDSTGTQALVSDGAGTLSWADIGGGGVVFGDPATDFTPTMIQYVDLAGNQFGDLNHTIDSSTGFTKLQASFTDPDDIYGFDLSDNILGLGVVGASLFGQNTTTGTFGIMGINNTGDEDSPYILYSNPGIGGGSFIIGTDGMGATQTYLDSQNGMSGENSHLKLNGGTLELGVVKDGGTYGVSANSSLYTILGAVDGGNGTQVVVADGNHDVSINAFFTTTYSGTSFSGTGLDDFGTGGTFTGGSAATYTITITGTGRDGLNTDTNFQSGASITDTTTGATFNVVSNTFIGGVYVMTIDTVVGTVNNGDALTDGTFSGFANGTIYNVDIYTWTDGTTTNNDVPVINTASTFVSNGLSFNWGAELGHTISDSWTFSYTPTVSRIADFAGEPRTVNLGDVDNVGFHTLFSLSDIGGYISEQALSWSAGDIGGYQNDTYAQIDDANRLFHVGGSFGSGAGVGDGLTLDFNNEIFAVGDYGSIGNSLALIINNIAQTVMFGGPGAFINIDTNAQALSFNFAGGSTSYLFPNINDVGALVNDGAGNLIWSPVATGSFTSGQVAYGDSLNQATSDSNFLWDAMNLKFSTGDPNSTTTQTWLIVDATSQDIQLNSKGTVRLGDSNLSGNHTQFITDDVAKNITAILDSLFSIQTVSGNHAFDADVSNYSVSMGDTSAASTSTIFSVNGAGQIIFAQTDGDFAVQNVAGHKAFEVVPASYNTAQGDIGGNINGTSFFVDDSSKAFNFNTGGTFNIFDSSANPWFVTNMVTQRITLDTQGHGKITIGSGGNSDFHNVFAGSLNSTYSVDDSSGNRVLLLRGFGNASGFQGIFGDVDAAQNDTYFLWNDDDQVAQISANLDIYFSTTRLHLGGGQITNYLDVSSTYTILDQDYTLDCTTGTFTITLPTAVGRTGQIYNIKNSGAGVITVATTGGQTIDGSSTKTLTTLINITVQSTGSKWIAI